ncbi:hypothetical protein MKJ04_13490 [Pontibacter sp. E15-1]|uniref:hypothetical protein n=1 Tax=Pontibacter sp. E15-1 TaxID=2919918 RepID=UPI001F4F8B98|nr:hypothetical protein [Pontibacter sp. E15-1]MCJ8165860.1 hypothetical protein [Pontibacter sp. E15-1]
MNRYLFWALIILPWIVLAVYLSRPKDDPRVTAFILVSLVIHLGIIFNIRRNAVGLTVAETLKAFVPLWGTKEFKRLYFQKV